ncbi:Undecaprenyl-phosphate mannosyltransferase [Rosistilla ulvae]|uniref:Undecaprenyl-phosphate mannosyltransferase n=1 Tax=Rosistilla ulvae TaxID=1930277 RepID=A0A517LXE4_9BACT|nr:glycosyltransferase [Rosistilla ulvae]QDS87304.1 Undecaprenyl-phosphate mannosyltransferase [Rosistilla ulvae]
MNVQSDSPSLPSEDKQRASLSPPSYPKSKVFVVLPAFNEEQALGSLLNNLGEAFADNGWPYEVIVVDDGSGDATADVASQYGFQMPIHLLKHPQNQGLGPTLRDGLREAAELATARDVILTMDADNTHPAGLIDSMVRRIKEGSDIVIASRFRDGAQVVGVPWNRLFLSVGARMLFSMVFPTKGVRDYTSGYRAYRAEAIQAGFACFGDDLVSETGFSCMADVLLKLRSLDRVFSEVPLILRYDQKEGVSKMKVMRTAILTLKLLARHRIAGV